MSRLESTDRRSVTLPRVLGPIDGVLRGRRLHDRLGDLPGPGEDRRKCSVHERHHAGLGHRRIFSGAGALTLAELGAMLPQAGGLYVFLRAAYGPLPAFLFGWVEFLVVRSGSMATLAAAFARYFAQLCPPPEAIRGEVWQAGAAVLAIAVVTAVNVLGTRRGGTLQVSARS